jgi:hypothetical protein
LKHRSSSVFCILSSSFPLISWPVYSSVVVALEVAAQPLVQRPCKKRLSPSTFPYVCPEPVLVKSSFLVQNGARKAGVFRTVVALQSRELSRFYCNVVRHALLAHGVQHVTRRQAIRAAEVLRMQHALFWLAFVASTFICPKPVLSNDRVFPIRKWLREDVFTSTGSVKPQFQSLMLLKNAAM